MANNIFNVTLVLKFFNRKTDVFLLLIQKFVLWEEYAAVASFVY